ncbi:DUF1877 family protein [Streptomyces sp. NPDC090445]|uniref:DUF1877 family protein n=1 Tax=Streptomyces sp. NPDC090445 TaxID=3365963 RepID=UPI003803C656
MRRRARCALRRRPRGCSYTARPLLELLLRRAGFPVDVSRGEEPVGCPDPEDGDYHYLTADRVGVAALELAGLPYDRPAAHADPQEPVEAGLCPYGWDGGSAGPVPSAPPDRA